MDGRNLSTSLTSPTDERVSGSHRAPDRPLQVGRTYRLRSLRHFRALAAFVDC